MTRADGRASPEVAKTAELGSSGYAFCACAYSWAKRSIGSCGCTAENILNCVRDCLYLRHSTSMRVLFLSPEVAPFSKTGGLADVAQVLPATLASMGHEVKVVTPLYASVNDGRLRPLDKSIRLRFP